nr:type VI secretion system lipoprotein TssJ [Marinicella sp. W31]MDC2875928.1 type VI secretion system lipoprotein TssJ [Marinicella sp. W31]
MQSDFESLTTDPKGTLQSTYVDMKQVQVTPDRSKPIKNIELKKDTTFIGIVAGYVNYQDINWRTTVQVNAKERPTSSSPRSHQRKSSRTCTGKALGRMDRSEKCH